MSLALYFTIPSGLIVFVSVPVYIVMLISLYKFRQEEPFYSSFFKISFNLGIFDLLHLFNDWVIGILPYVGCYNFILKHADTFARQFSILWWYSAWAQKLGVLLLAIDRLACIRFRYNFTTRETKILMAINWTIPVLITIPQFFANFGYQTFNGTNALLVYWKNENYEWAYFNFCFLFCTGISFICAACYSITFYTVYQHKKLMGVLARRNNKTEAKLACVGFLLFIITLLCGIFCWILVMVKMSLDKRLFMIGLLQILFDMYCCINPYLLLGCSKKARTYFKAVLFQRPPESFESTGSNVYSPLLIDTSFSDEKQLDRAFECDMQENLSLQTYGTTTKLSKPCCSFVSL